MQIILDTVYKVQDFKNRIQNGKSSFEFAVGTVDVYVSNKIIEPANQAAMTQDDRGTFDPGLHSMYTNPVWILWTVASGSPIINENGIVNVNKR